LKLDIEHEIEREFFQQLKFDPSGYKEIQWRKRNNIKTISNEEISRLDNRVSIIKEIVLDFQIKSHWEDERNNNLSNYNVISALVKCPQCYQIYSIPFEIEKGSLNEIECRYCKKSSIKFYDFENEMNQLSEPRWTKFVNKVGTK